MARRIDGWRRLGLLLMAVAHLVFTKQAGTGVQVVEGFGFRPKAVFLFWTQQTSHGLTDGCAIGQGVSDGTLNFGRYSALDDASANANGCYVNSYTRCVVIVPTAASGTPTITDEAWVSGFTSDGFDLTWVTNSGSALLIHAVAIGGSHVSVAQRHVTVSGTLSPITVSGLGFRPDAVLAIPSNTAADLAFAPSAIVYAPGMSTGGDQRSMYGLLRGDAAADAATYGAKTTRLASLRNIVGALFHAAENEWVSLTAMTADGATLQAAHSTKVHALLFISGLRVAVGTVSSPASPGDVSVDLGFEAQGAIFTATPTETDSAGQCHLSIGAWTPSSAGSVAISYDDSVAAVQSNVTSKVARILTPNATAGSSTERLAATVTQTLTGFTATFSASTAASRPVYYLAFGDITIGSCTGGLVPTAVDPDPGPSWEGLGPHFDRVIVEVDLDSGTERWALQDPLNAPPDLVKHPGRMDGRVIAIGSIIRRATDTFGSWQASSVRFTLDDGDRRIRGLIAAGQWYNREVRIYVANYDDLDNDRCLFRGIVRAYPPGADEGMTVDVEATDFVTSEFSPLSPDRDIMAGAVFDSTRVPSAPRTLLDQDPPKPFPVYMGLWSDEASDADPPVLTGSSAIGSRVVGGVWTMGFGTMPSGPGTPSNLTAVVAAGGSIAAADSPYGVLYAQVWGVDGSGNAGDPYPFLPDGLPITITGTGKKITLTVTAGFTPTKWRFALATKYYGARWLQILEVAGGTTSVVFDVHPVFQGGLGFVGPLTSGAFPPTLSRRWYRIVALVGGARTSPSAECMAYENTPYYRPIHVTCVADGGVDSYEVYGIDFAPMQPFTSYNRRWTVPLQTDANGYQYFEDSFDDAGVDFVAGITAPVGMLPVTDTGDEAISGVSYGRLVVSRWAMREIIGVYAGGQRLADNHPDLLHPDHPSWPFPDRTRLLGDVDATVVYAKGQILNGHRDNSAPVQVNACTTEDVGDGTGNGIDQSADIAQFLMTELAQNDHKSGVYAGIPTFNDGTATVNTGSFARVKANQIVRIGGTGYPGRVSITKPTTVRELQTLLVQSFFMLQATDAHGRLMAGEIDAPVADVSALRRYSGLREIVGHLQIDPRGDQLETQIVAQHTFRPLSEDYETTKAKLPTDVDAPTDPAVIENRGKIKVGQVRSLPYPASSDAIADVMLRTLTAAHYVREWVSVPAPIGGLSSDIFDVIVVDDEEGLGADGYEAVLVRVLEHEIIPPNPSQDRPLTTVLHGLRIDPILDELEAL